MIKINGKIYEGNNLAIIGGNVLIDGNQISDIADGNASGLSYGILQVEITGNPVSVTSSASVIVHGYVNGNIEVGGSIECGDVFGDVAAGGSIHCGKVGGDVDAGVSVSIR